MTASEAFNANRYIVRRKVLKLVGGAFQIFDPSGNLIAFSEQKAFKLKEDIRVFTDKDKTTEILSIQARQIIDWSAAYDVYDSLTGVKVGALRRQGGRSILRDEWHLLDASDAKIGMLIEDSMALALVRRFLVSLIPQRYDVFMPDAENGTQVASLKQNFNPFVYKLDVDLSLDPQGRFDRRLGIAAAILLAAIEGKQRD